MSGLLFKRRQREFGAEFLETRQLLNAHVPHSPAVQVAAASSHAIHQHAPAVHAAATAPKVIHQISGTLTGQGVYTEDTVNTALGTDTYSVTGKTNHGVVTLASQDSVNSPLVTATTYHDVYYGGDATLTLQDGSTIAISYIGSGHSSSLNGKYTATFKGVATGSSGAELGQQYSFTASVVGNSANNNAVTIKFSLKG
jgi:hypothetical protein